VIYVTKKGGGAALFFVRPAAGAHLHLIPALHFFRQRAAASRSSRAIRSTAQSLNPHISIDFLNLHLLTR
jgi:hypothetical protein